MQPQAAGGVNEMFAQAVKGLRAKHGLSQMQAEIKTGVDRFTISRMEQGLVPRLDIVEKWARGFGEDVNRWRELAGYQPVYNHTHRFFDEVNRIRQESGVDFQISAEELQLVRESPEALEQYMAAIRARVLARQQG